MATDPRELIVRNLFFLQQLGNSLSDEAAELLRALFDEIVAHLAKMDPNAAAHRYRGNRLKKLIERIQELVESAYDEILTKQRSALAGVGAQQSKQATQHLRVVLGDGKAGTLHPATGLGTNFFKALVDTRPLHGALLKDWFEDQKTRTVFRVNQQLQLGMVNGETIDQMVRRIRGRSVGSGRYEGGVMQTSTRDAEAIVRTAVNQISTEARFATFQENEDITREYQYVATLDERTTLICASLDGMRWRYDDPDAKRPPQHVRCRSTIIPIVDWERMGLTPPPEGTRASKDGQVPASTTYEQWLKDQPATVQDEILGPGRAELFRQGKVGLKDLVRTDGRRVSLRDLGAGGGGGPIPPVPPGPSSDPLWAARERILPLVLADEKVLARRRTEYARAWDLAAEDRVLFGKSWNRPASRIETSSGSLAGVWIDPNDYPALRDSILTHNHPSGAPFSPADLRSAAKWHLYEIRVVGRVNTFSAIRPIGGWDPAALESALAAFELAWNDAKARGQDTRQLAHTLWKRYLTPIGVRYSATRT